MVSMHTSYHYDILCYALQGAILKPSFLAKSCQPYGYDDQMALVDPLIWESTRDMSQIPLLLLGIYGMGLTTGLPITIIVTMTMPLIAMALAAITLTLGPWHFMYLVYSSIN